MAPRDSEATPGGPNGTLFHLADDPQEVVDLSLEQPDVVARLHYELAGIRAVAKRPSLSAYARPPPEALR
jgi:hypothetical protein